MNRNLLLISNSTNAGEEYLAWPRTYLKEFYEKSGVKDILFIPYAGVNLTPESVEKSYDVYEKRVASIFKSLGFALHSVHRAHDIPAAVRKAKAIAVGGGNTFHLVRMMQETGIMKLIREQIHKGIPYAGWSAGANVACPTLRTTNDMPVCEPASFECLNLVPFQINPHYLDANPAGFAGETREQRILEFLTVNRNITVVGLREGCLLTITGNTLKLTGQRPLRVFRYGKQTKEYTPEDDLNFLLEA